MPTRIGGVLDAVVATQASGDDERDGHHPRSAGPASGALRRAGIDPHPVAGLQVGLVLLEAAHLAVVQPHVDAVADHALAVVALHVVADHRATDRTDGGRGFLPVAVADLVAQDATDHAASDGTDTGPARALGDRLDAADVADLGAGDARLGRR